MKFNQTITAAAIATALLPMSVIAGPTVTLSGAVGGKVVLPLSDNEDADIATKATTARANITAKQMTNLGMVIGSLEMDFDNLANSGNADVVDVRKASVVLASKKGTFVIAGRGRSAQSAKLVGPVDRFNHGGAEFFKQAAWGSNVLAYVTPELIDGLKLSVATLTPQAPVFVNNGEHFDIQAVRADYNSDKFSASIGHVMTPGVPGPGADFTRTAFGLNTKIGSLDLGLAFESNSGDDDETQVLGLAGTAPIGASGALSVGLNAIVGAKEGSTEADKMAYQVLYAHSASEQVSLWAELNEFNEEAATDGAVAVGLDLSF